MARANRFWLLGIGAGLALGACDPYDNVGFFIQGGLAPDKECHYGADNDFLPAGLLDVANAGRYFLNPLFRSQLVPRQNASAPSADPNKVLIQEAYVELRDTEGKKLSFIRAADGAVLPNPFRVTATGFVEPQGAAPGSIEVIPPVYTDILRPLVLDGTLLQIIVAVRVVGKTLGDVEIESDEFLWPVAMCASCLVECLANPTDEETRSCAIGNDQLSSLICE